MSDIDTYVKRYSEIPECCKLCKRLYIDQDDESVDPITSCGIDLRFPTVKNHCNAQIIQEK